MNIIRVVFGTVLVNAAGAGYWVETHHPYDWSLALACLAADIAGVLILAWRR